MGRYVGRAAAVIRLDRAEREGGQEAGDLGEGDEGAAVPQRHQSVAAPAALPAAEANAAGDAVEHQPVQDLTEERVGRLDVDPGEFLQASSGQPKRTRSSTALAHR